MPVRRRRLSRHHHSHRPLRRVHALRAQQRGVMARAHGGAADDRALVPVGGRLLSRASTHRRRRPARFPHRTCKDRARLVPRALHARHQRVHAGVGDQAGRGHLVSEHRRIPDRDRRHGLPADPHRRRPHRPVRDRALSQAGLLRGARAGNRRRDLDRVAANGSHGRRHSGRHLHHRLPPGDAGRLCARARGRAHRAVGGHPARGRHAQGLRRHERVLAARDPVLRARRRDHGGGRHGRAAGQSRQGVRRLHPRRHGAGQHRGLDAVRLHLGVFRGRHRGGRLGHDPADDQERLSAAVCRQRHDLRLAAAATAATLSQHDHLFARCRRHDLGSAVVRGRGDPGPAAGPVPDRARARHRASRPASERRGRAIAAGAQDRRRCDLGDDHGRDHSRRHPVRAVHADRIRRDRLRLCLPGDDVRLPRLQMAGPAALDRARSAHGRHGDDHDRLLDRLRLSDGDPADPRQGHRVLRRHIK